MVFKGFPKLGKISRDFKKSWKIPKGFQKFPGIFKDCRVIYKILSDANSYDWILNNSKWFQNF